MSDTPIPPQGPEENKPVVPEGSATPSAPGGAGAAPGAGSAPVAYGGPGTPEVPDAADVEKNKVMAALSYVSILWLVPLLAAKDSPYAKFHCNQGILLSIISFGAAIVMVIGSIVIGFIPVIGWCMGCLMQLLLLAFVLTFAILGIMNAVNGRLKTLPMFPRVTWVK